MKLFKTELLKIKTMGIFQFAILAPFVTLLVAAKFYINIKANIPEVTPWQGLEITSSTMFIGMLLPIFIIYVTMVMGKIENLNNGWKQALVMPVSRGKIYLTKYLVVLFSLITALVSYLIEYSLIAYFLGAKGMIPGQMFINIIYVFITLQPFIAILFFLSNRFNSVVLPISIGMTFILSNLLIIQSKYWIYAPWTYGMRLVQGGLNMMTEVLPLIIVSLLLFVTIFSLDIITFKRKDIM